MLTAADIFTLLHYGLLPVFLGGTAVWMLKAIVARLRVRRPRIVWQPPAVVRVPLRPTLFLGALSCVGMGMLEWGGTVPVSAWVGYPAGGVFWFVAAWVARATLVTEYALVPEAARLDRAVAWSQIVDYAETRRHGRPHFVFVYRARDTGTRRRLDLPVPARAVDAFRQLLTAKLNARLSQAPDTPVDMPVGQTDDSPDAS